MLVFKHLLARCGLFRSGTVQLEAAPLRSEFMPGPSFAQVRLSTLGLSIDRAPLYRIPAPDRVPQEPGNRC